MSTFLNAHTIKLKPLDIVSKITKYTGVGSADFTAIFK